MGNSRLHHLGNSPDLGADSRPKAPVGATEPQACCVFSFLNKGRNLKVLKELRSLGARPRP